MELIYRQVIHNVSLSKEDAETLKRATEILKEAKEMLHSAINFNQYDEDICEIIDETYDQMLKCNGRLNVDLICDEGEW